MILYRIVRRIFWMVGKVLWRLSIEGRENVPAEGPFIMAPVHRSNIDFAMISCATDRKMRFMGKDTLWKVKWFGRLITILGAYPVHRGVADREALRSTIDILEGGEPLVLFPEGTRRFGPTVEDLYEGAAYVAARAGVPLVPIGIGGSEGALPKGSKVPRPVKVHLIVGPPIFPPPTPEGRRNPSRRAVHQLTLELQAELQRLFDLAQQKAGAPSLASTDMGFLDKAKELAGEHADKVGDAIDKAAGAIDERTGGKYGEHIDKGAEAAKRYVDDNRTGEGNDPPPVATP